MKGLYKKVGMNRQQKKSVPVISTKGVVTDADSMQQTILSRLGNLEGLVKNLSSDCSRKTRHIQSLQKQLHDFKQENKRLTNENKELRSQLSKSSGGSTPTMNSQNSSTPPSKDSIKVSQERVKRTRTLAHQQISVDSKKNNKYIL